MAMANYTDLQAAVANWMHRNDLTGSIPDFITLAEARIKALITSRIQQEVVQVATVAGVEYVLMPNDTIGIKSIAIPSVQNNVDYMSADMFNNQFDPETSGIPRCYTIVGGFIYLGPTPDAIYTLHITQSAEFAPLTDLAPTNALLSKWPNVYLWGALTEAAKFCRDLQLKEQFDADFLIAVNSVNVSEWNTPGPMSVRTDVRHSW